MGASHNCQPEAMGLLPHANNLMTKQFNAREAIMAAIPSHLLIIIHFCNRLPHFIFGLHQARSPELGSNHCYTLCNFTISIILSMPWERGKPRCSPAWYNTVARQKRLQRLERALSIARTQRAQIACKDGSERMAWSPPTTFVEEVIPKKPIQLSPESMLFTVPENWQSPSNFLEEDTQSATTAHHKTNTMAEEMEEFHIFYVEEEFPEELLHMAAQEATLSMGYTPSRVTEREEDKSTGRERSSGAPEQSRGWNLSSNKQVCGGWHVEGGWQGPSATSYLDCTRTVACPPTPLPLGTTRFGV